jgi:hypothetical protein|tara:strand:+ start:1185 stop:1382 length:198 start_codon:yes stop_codon:yes gene_type:complete
MDFSSYHPAVIAIAADMLGWKKTVHIKANGNLEWYGASSHPTANAMMAKMTDAQAEYDANGAKGS